MYSGRDADSVSHYYPYTDGMKISPLEKFAKVSRDGDYELDGWYRTRTLDENGKPVYSDKWNFSADSVTQSGLTLYAKWNANTVYTFEFVYFEDGEEKVAKKCEVAAGGKLGDVDSRDPLTYANYKGHTAIALYYDEQHTLPFDKDKPHPGGEVAAVKIYAEYIEGDYTLVGTAAELVAAAKNDFANVYLLNDIDMGGASLGFKKFKNRKFAGNGHKVSNFKLDYPQLKNDLAENPVTGYKDTLCASLFGNVQNSEISDVSFENVTIEINTFLSDITNICVAPLAFTSVNGTFKNVKVSGTVKCAALPVGLTALDVKIVSDRGVYVDGETGSETGCRFDIKLSNNENN